MKEQMFTCVRDLAGLIRDSEEYTQYLAAREKVLQDEGSVQVLQDLRQRQMRLQLMGMMGEETADSEQELDDIYMALSLNPILGEYLTAEYRLSKILRRIRKIFGETLGNDADLIFAQQDNDLVN